MLRGMGFNPVFGLVPPSDTAPSQRLHRHSPLPALVGEPGQRRPGVLRWCITPPLLTNTWGHMGLCPGAVPWSVCQYNTLRARERQVTAIRRKQGFESHRETALRPPLSGTRVSFGDRIFAPATTRANPRQKFMSRTGAGVA